MRFLTQAGIVLLAALTATITEAQSTPQARVNTAAAKPPAGIPSPPPTAPPAASSLLDQPARPAEVQLNAGKLTIKADNSTLSGILHEISSKTGMTVDGLSRDQRVFGDYGPAAPREVLSALLDGMGYNVMMLGTLASGAPRELTLTPRTGGGATPGNHAMQVARQNSNSDDDDDSSVPDQQDNNIPPRPEATPPEASPPPQDQQQPSTNPGQVKTPQQMLQELQQMRQRQLDQQQQQANPQ